VNHPSSNAQRNDLKPGRRANGPGIRSRPGGTVFHPATRVDAMAANGKFEPPPFVRRERHSDGFRKSGRAVASCRKFMILGRIYQRLTRENPSDNARLIPSSCRDYWSHGILAADRPSGSHFTPHRRRHLLCKRKLFPGVPFVRPRRERAFRRTEVRRFRRSRGRFVGHMGPHVPNHAGTLHCGPSAGKHRTIVNAFDAGCE
jgi:hypothetical protein